MRASIPFSLILAFTMFGGCTRSAYFTAGGTSLAGYGPHTHSAVCHTHTHSHHPAYVRHHTTTWTYGSVHGHRSSYGTYHKPPRRGGYRSPYGTYNPPRHYGPRPHRHRTPHCPPY